MEFYVGSSTNSQKKNFIKPQTHNLTLDAHYTYVSAHTCSVFSRIDSYLLVLVTNG